MTGLELRSVSVTYPGRPPIRAVVDVSLTVERGEIVGLLGPSGCGKSSVLGAIVGSVHLASGSVHFDGDDLVGVPVHRRGFGMVFQDGQLFPHRSVEGNISFGLEMAGVPRATRQTAIEDLLELVGLEGYGPRSVAALSGGERQRVALARSLAPRPRLLALDEPLSSLDATLRARLGRDTREALQASGTTAIVVTHDEQEATLMCDRIILMSAGRIIV